MSPLTPITTPLVTSSGAVDVFIAEDRYALIATSVGVDILDLYQGKIVGSGTLPDTPTSITADWTTASGNMYIGTTSSGIFTVRYHPSRYVDFTNNLVQSYTTTSTPPISSNTVRDLDCRPGRLLIGTSAGVDFFSGESAYATRALASGVNDVHLTSSGGYWTTKSGNAGEVEVNYNLISTVGTSIITVDFRYSASSNPALPAEPPADIAISEVIPRALAFATPSGAFVAEENPGNEASAQSKTITSDNIVSVDFSNGAYFSSGVLYLATTAYARTYLLDGNTLSGTHTYDPNEGTGGQPLVTGTITIVRTTNLA